MKLRHFLVVVFSVILSSCASISEQGTLAQLRDVEIVLEDEKIVGGIEKAMQSYQQFLEQTPESAMTPEAIRRLADLKIERETNIIDAKLDTELSAPSKAVTKAPAKKSGSGAERTGGNNEATPFGKSEHLPAFMRRPGDK